MHSTMLLVWLKTFSWDYGPPFLLLKIHSSSFAINMHSFEGGSPWITVMPNTDLKEHPIEIFLRGNLKLLVMNFLSTTYRIHRKAN